MAKQAKKEVQEIEISVPPLGETVESALIARWLFKEGEIVEEGEAILELETDKISLEVPAPVRGVLRSPLPVSAEVKSGDFLAKLDLSAKELAQAKLKEAPLVEVPAQKMPVQPEIKRQAPPSAPMKEKVPEQSEADEKRLKLSPLRLAVARNLKEIQNHAAVLTTFTEVDMSEVMALRKRYQKEFIEAHEGIKLGFMSFFATAVARALNRFPVMNAYIEGDETVYRRHANLGVAVTTDKGLVVPVIKAAEALGFAEIEKKVADFAVKARESRLVREDLSGASFTLSNGGIFGSLLSTPLLSPKQSGVLGLHAIKERPVALEGQVVIRPMMYVALSYDHRLVDGKEGVSFLRTVKELVEDPARLLLDI
ncbi:dihydrolipoyllysine succinyltransferase [Acetobacteraceae bacterium]|nr:dihydrolipoyllysine succinyltransferase [Acetobacteraceae bacterium]